MKLCLALLFTIAPFLAFAHDGEHSHLYEEVHTDQLKQMMSSGGVIVIDARTKDQDDRNRIPGAKSLPYNASDAQVSSTLPSKETAVVVYCTNKRCPASAFLAERLATLGYQRAYRYPDGINDWIKRGNKIEHAK
jgi:rhodanese-related sulfurtransferase